MGYRDVRGLSLPLVMLLILSFMAASGSSDRDADPQYRQVPFDIFINHRGPDVKYTLAGHIYHHLLDRGYTPFLDEHSIKTGEVSWEAIQNAMRTAAVFVVILSPRYAESKWCMDELLDIVETGKPIIPVFYKISPSELQMKAEGVYARAFHEHATSGKFDNHTLEKWQDAFRKVKGIEGYRLHKNEDEGALVRRIATRITEYIGKPAWPACDAPRMISIHATICEPHVDKDANCVVVSIIGSGTFTVGIRNSNVSLDIHI